jgi:AcrR family transcriptional regulator
METGDKMNLADRRVAKTRKAIFVALSELLQEKKYSKITVQEIIDRADVGRATFYSHFPTKDDLLCGSIENIFESLSEQLNGHMTQGQENELLPVAALFAHIKENKRIIIGVAISESGELLFEKFKSYWGNKIRPLVIAHIPNVGKPIVPIDMLVNHSITTLIELIKFWIQDGLRYTPEQMEQYFFELIYPVLSKCAINGHNP